MAFDGKCLTAVSVTSRLIYVVNLRHCFSLIAALVLIVAPCRVIVDKLCISSAEPEHYICVVTGLDRTHYPTHCVFRIGIEHRIFFYVSFKFNSVAVEADFNPWELW